MARLSRWYCWLFLSIPLLIRARGGWPVDFVLPARYGPIRVSTWPRFARQCRGFGLGSDLGTKSYRHVIPGLSSSGQSSVSGGGTATSDFAYQDEKRKRRGGAGYRRARGGEDEL